MQFIEKSAFGLRSAIYRLRQDDASVEFLLVPMIHLGARAFYAEVERQLATCDLILMEGVSSRRVWLLMLSYRLARRINRLKLVTQQEALPVARFRDKVIHADLPGQRFDAGLQALPLATRVYFWLLAPALAFYLVFFGTKRRLAAILALDDLPSRAEVLSQDKHWDRLDALLVDERDRSIIRAIDHVYRTSQRDEQGVRTVGLVYGAMHMRNITHFLLDTLGYRVATAEWITVFEL